MTSEQPRQPVKEYLRWKSDLMKYAGFRYSPDHQPMRCQANFTRDRLQGKLFLHGPSYDHDDIFFTTRTGDRLLFVVTGVRRYELDDYSEPWLGTAAEDVGSEPGDYYLIEGELRDEDGCAVEVEAFDDDTTPDAKREWGWMPPDRNPHCTRNILALVVFGWLSGEPLGAIVQLLPSPAEQLVYIPAP